MRNFSLRCTYWLAGLPIIFFICLAGTSCTNSRQLTYLQGSFDTAKLSQIPFPEPVIQKGDALSILVFSDNPAATAIFNQQQTGSSPSVTPSLGTSGGGETGGGGSGGSSSVGGGSSGGYLVDSKGNIQFQEIGQLHVEGLTRVQLQDTLSDRLKQYLNNPYTSVRFLSFRFTILGEVMRPGMFSFPSDHLNLLQALGMSGDLTFFGRRDNILVIREQNGVRQFGRMDLTKPEVMASPYFYLQPNDLIYVEASNKKIAANDQTFYRNVTLASAIITTLAVLYSLFK